MRRTQKFQTTLGDLIVALTEETGRHVRDEQTAYELVAYILADMMGGTKRRPAVIGQR
jgi:hypothetical protein